MLGDDLPLETFRFDRNNSLGGELVMLGCQNQNGATCGGICRKQNRSVFYFFAGLNKLVEPMIRLK